MRAGRARSGSLVALTIGGSALAFLSLFLVVPFLLSNTGPAGFLIGFLASLIPLSVVLLAVYVIDKWEPSQNGSCSSPSPGALQFRLR